MSSKGRKAVEAEEFYPTPRRSIEALLTSPLVTLPGGTWIEPCAGTGRIIATVNDLRKDIDWTICELQEQFKPQLSEIVRPCDTLMFGDFVHREWPFKRASVLIMNPPFSLTMQFIQAAFERAMWIVCLQRKNWFGTQGRSPFLIQHCPDDYTLSERPSFRPDGSTDSVEYSWFIWPPGDRKRRVGTLAMLDAPDGGQGSLF